ncbi:MAG: insulinase family protein [Bdellovibrionaceae bacterium]|nr:insulinase family protein [Pseudobdellovibrionaceae bacterium]
MIKKFQLKNGFTVLLNPLKKSPVVSLQVWVGNGSAHETQDEAGVSHFIEHLVFKGTTSFGPGEIAQTIEGCGGQLNAYTTFDQTVYYVTLGKSEIETGLKALSEMVFSPTFDPEEVNREREVVIEEIRRGMDEPSRVSTQFSFAHFFKDHPYGRPIIGYDEVVQNIPVEKIKAYFQEQYHPNNMFLLITGDFEDDVLESVKTHFGQETQDHKKLRSVPPTRFNPNADLEFLKTEFEDTFLNFYWSAPDVKSKDYLCLELLALILGQGESSRLYKKLKLQKECVRSVGAYPFSIKHPGLFAISIKPITGQEDTAVEEVVSVLNELALEGVQEEEFEKAIINFKSDLYYSLETCDGLARQVGQVTFFYGDENYLNKYIKELDEIAITDINLCLQKYLLKKPKTFITSKNESLKSKRYSDIFDSKLAKAVTEKSSTFTPKLNLSWQQHETTDSRIHQFIVGPGVKLFLKDQKETPVIHMDVGFLGGAKIESSHEDISATFAQRCWARSTAQWNEDKTLFELEKMASSISAFSGKHSLGLQMTTISPYRDRLLQIFPEFLTYTTTQDQIIQRESKLMLEGYKRRKDNPAQIAFLEFMKMAFGEHYYSKDSIKILSETRPPIAAQVSDFIGHHFDPKNMVISMVGDLGSIDRAKQSVEDMLSQMTWVQNDLYFDTTILVPDAQEKTIESDKEQSHIIFGFRGLDYRSKSKATLSVIQSILAGQGGRLFIELRDKESLAYTVSPIRMEGLEGGYFGSYIACAPSKKDKAIAMMKEEFLKLTHDLVPKEELRSAKKSLIGKMQISLQRNSNVSENIFFDSLYGLNHDQYLLFEEQINFVTAEDIRDLMIRLYAQPHYTVVVG